jgi:ribosomal protein S27AE
MPEREENMAKQKIICPKCGGEMNHHADKLVNPVTAEEAKKINVALGGIIEETHYCPGCGAAESHRTE